MLSEPFTSSIPDELPKKLDCDPGTAAEIERLHARLKLRIKDNQKRRSEYHIAFNPAMLMHARLALVVDMFIGILSPERLNFELKWAEMVMTDMEQSIAEYRNREREAREGKDLHLPNGQVLKVAPKEDKSNDGG